MSLAHRLGRRDNSDLTVNDGEVTEHPSTEHPSDVYFSVDVETDGPIPGPFSMSSIGACVAGTFDGASFDRIDPADCVFYAELKPISDKFDPDAAAIAGLDRARLQAHGQDPEAAMTEFARWVRDSAERFGGRPVFVAYPLGFDWMFMYWYLIRYTTEGSPFGFSGCLDVKTMYATKAGTVVGKSTKRSMPRSLLESRFEHRHHALADAQGQADLFANLMHWTGPTHA